MSDIHNEFISKHIYTVEKDKYGHTIILCQPLDRVKPSKALKEKVVSYLIAEVAKALKISNTYGNKRSYVHVYMGGCLLKYYSVKFYKKLFETLDKTYEDTLEAAFVYDLPYIAECAWNVLKYFIDTVTRDKIHMLSSTHA